MLRKSVVVLSVMVCLGVITALRGFGQTTQRPPASPPAPDQLGEGILVLVVEQRGSIEAKTDTRILKDAKLVKLGDRFFVRGKGHVAKKFLDDPRYSWYVGVDSAISWDSVIGFQLLTPEQFEQYLRSYEENE